MNRTVETALIALVAVGVTAVAVHAYAAPPAPLPPNPNPPAPIGPAVGSQVVVPTASLGGAGLQSGPANVGVPAIVAAMGQVAPFAVMIVISTFVSGTTGAPSFSGQVTGLLQTNGAQAALPNLVNEGVPLILVGIPVAAIVSTVPPNVTPA